MMIFLRKNIKRELLFLFLLFIILNVLFQNCNSVSFNKTNLNNLTNDNNNNGKLFCKNESFNQPHEIITKAVDILFIFDTSASLYIEIEAIVDGLDEFMLALPADGDYRVAIMLAHGSTSQYTGKLWQTSKWDPAVITINNENPVNIAQEKMRNKIFDSEGSIILASDHDADGGEEGLYTLYEALSSDKLNMMKQQGFMRDNAALSVVFLADENDICAIYPQGVTPVYDNEKLEPAANQRDCGNVNHLTVYERISLVRGVRPLIISGIVYNNINNIPNGVENEYGYGYIDLIQLANGLSVDLSGDDFGSKLRSIGEMTTKKLNLITSWKLGESGFVSNSLKVTVDKVQVPFNYSNVINEIQIQNQHAGNAGSMVETSYCFAQ